MPGLDFLRAACLLGLGWIASSRAEAVPEWIRLASTNGTSLVSTALETPIAPDRSYKIQILPPEMTGTWMLQRPVALMAHNVTNLVEVTQPAEVYAAVLYKYIGMEKFTDTHFEELENQGWMYVEDEFKTTTFQSEHWDWQVLRKKVQPGAVTFRSHSSMILLFLKENSQP